MIKQKQQEILRHLFIPIHILVLQSSYFIGHVPTTEIVSEYDQEIPQSQTAD